MDLIDLVHKMITNGNLKFAQLLRNALVEKVSSVHQWPHFCYIDPLKNNGRKRVEYLLYFHSFLAESTGY